MVGRFSSLHFTGTQDSRHDNFPPILQSFTQFAPHHKVRGGQKHIKYYLPVPFPFFITDIIKSNYGFFTVSVAGAEFYALWFIGWY